jgi:aldose 1-epimerase
MFQVVIEPFGEINKIKLVNTLNQEFAEIIADQGAALNNLAFLKDNELIEVIEGNESYDYMLKEGKPRFFGQILFPFPNRINNGMYVYKGKLYQLEINEAPRNHALHGLLHDKSFQLVRKEETDDFVQIEIEHELDASNAGYPFKAKITVIYTLEKGGLTIETNIKNIDNQVIPFGLGWHPFFKIGDSVNDLEIQIPAHKVFELDERLIPTEKLVTSYDFIKKEKVDGIWIDRGCFLTKDEEVSSIWITKENVSVEIWMKRGKDGLNFLQTYIPPTRSSIALEPQTCATNVFNNKIGLLELAPNEEKSFVWGIKMK